MNTPRTTGHRVARTWSARILAALMVLAGCLAVVAAPASAGEPWCEYPDGSNACLRLDYRGFSYWKAIAGVDVHLPQRYAQEIVECGDSAFQATLFGDDGEEVTFIRNLNLDPGWPVSGPAGLSAELSADYIHDSELDEDKGDVDEIFAVISYHDCHIPWSRFEFRTGTIRGEFRG